MKKIKVALIGYGFSGRVFHLAPLVLNEGFEVKKIMTRNAKSQTDLSILYPNIKIITSFDDAILDPEIDLVVIAVSNDMHYEYTKLALKHKKHVICEKPFVDTYKKAKELFELANQNNVLLRIFHNRRYDGDMITIKKLLKEKDFGKLLTFETRFDRYVPKISENWRYKKTDMSGLFYDLAPHLIHHCIELFGLPSEVSNKLYFDREGSVVDDHFEMQLKYDSGLVCSLGASVLERDPKPRFKVVGTKGTYVKYGYDTPDTVNSKTTEQFQDKKLRSEFFDENLIVEKIPLYMGRHYDFYDAVANEIKTKIYNNENRLLALSVVLVMEYALKSNKKNKSVKMPITLP